MEKYTEKKVGYADLEQVSTDIASMEKFYKEDLKFDEVIVTMDPSKAEIDREYKYLKEKLAEANKDDQKSILLAVYASCHGVLEHTTKIVLNEIDPSKKNLDGS